MGRGRKRGMRREGGWRMEDRREEGGGRKGVEIQ